MEATTTEAPRYYYDEHRKVELRADSELIAFNLERTASVIPVEELARICADGDELLYGLILVEAHLLSEQERAMLEAAHALLPVFYLNGHFISLPEVIVCEPRSRHPKVLARLQSQDVPSFTAKQQEAECMVLVPTSGNWDDALRLANRLVEGTPSFVAHPHFLRLGRS